MKKIIFLLAIISSYCSYSQSVDILLYDFGSGFAPGLGASQQRIIDSYESVGFQVNLDFANIDTSLNTNNYDVLILEDYGDFFQWIININETQRQLVEDFVVSGGHVVWTSESQEPNIQHQSNITINNIYGTNLVNGAFFLIQAFGDPIMSRIHPSNGPGGLSTQNFLSSTISHSSTLNVPNCNKVYTSFEDNFVTNYSPCNHTVISVFPSKPKPDQGSIILSNERAIPFKAFGFEQTSNSEFDSTIALLHYHLLVDQDLSFNEWTDDDDNLNPDCPPFNTHFSYSDTLVCLGDTITITTENNTGIFVATAPGVYNLTINIESGLCVDDTLINVEIVDTIAQVPNEASICLGEGYVFNALNTRFDSAIWNNGVINNQEFFPTQDQYYTLTLYDRGCVGVDSVYVSLETKPDIELSITKDSICLGEEVVLNASTNNSMANIQWNNGIVNNQSFSPDSSGTFIARASISGCLTTDSIKLYVGENPQIIITDNFSVCEESVISLFAEVSEGANFSWSNDIENGLPFKISESTLFRVSAEKLNCIANDSVMVEVYPKVNANFEYSVKGNSNYQFEGYFNNNSTIGSGIEYNWIFWDNLNYSNDFEPSYIFNSSEEFVDVSLLVNNQYGCIDSITKSIMLNPEIFDVFNVPNAFTPNDDQTNDIFKPILNKAPRKYEFTIYNRWGEQVFKTNDYNEGWDGTYKGNLVADGIYVAKLLINRKPYTQSFTIMGAN